MSATASRMVDKAISRIAPTAPLRPFAMNRATQTGTPSHQPDIRITSSTATKTASTAVSSGNNGRPQATSFPDPCARTKASRSRSRGDSTANSTTAAARATCSTARRPRRSRTYRTACTAAAGALATAKAVPLPGMNSRQAITDPSQAASHAPGRRHSPGSIRTAAAMATRVSRSPTTAPDTAAMAGTRASAQSVPSSRTIRSASTPAHSARVICIARSKVIDVSPMAAFSAPYTVPLRPGAGMKSTNGLPPKRATCGHCTRISPQWYSSPGTPPLGNRLRPTRYPASTATVAGCSPSTGSESGHSR